MIKKYLLIIKIHINTIYNWLKCQCNKNKLHINPTINIKIIKIL